MVGECLMSVKLGLVIGHRVTRLLKATYELKVGPIELAHFPFILYIKLSICSSGQDYGSFFRS